MSDPSEEDDYVAASEHRVPEYWMEDTDVEGQDFQYSIRGPEDWVSSGPLGVQGAGPGRRFDTWKQAEAWARGFYGERFKGRIAEAAIEGHNRWAFLVRGPRGEICTKQSQ